MKTFSAVLALALFLSTFSLAFETDQYNLPPEPLADVGDEVTEYVGDKLRIAVSNLNGQIARAEACLAEKLNGCGSAADEQRKLAGLRSEASLGREFFELVGDGNLFVTSFGRWIRSHKFRGQPDRHKAEIGESIFILNPPDYLTLSPTVRLYGAEFGTDKLEHFFQQGHQYYEIRHKALAVGASVAEAEKKAIKWGQRTERTYFGILVSGVYSNADLYANYAGMRFYDALTKPLRINGRTRPAIVCLDKGSWRINGDADLNEHLLKPFFSDHMNEAWNPSSFRLTLVRSVRRVVKKHDCPGWLEKYPDVTADDLENRSKALETWNGEDYGFTKRSRTVTIAETCFEKRRDADEVSGQKEF
ncbi:MAG: hypothetical protein AB7J13_09215 [Pyrinomonadaceae bacterium]